MSCPSACPSTGVDQHNRQQTPFLLLFASRVVGRWGVSCWGEFVRTGRVLGVPLVRIDRGYALWEPVFVVVFVKVGRKNGHQQVVHRQVLGAGEFGIQLVRFADGSVCSLLTNWMSGWRSRGRTECLLFSAWRSRLNSYFGSICVFIFDAVINKCGWLATAVCLCSSNFEIFHTQQVY